MIQQKKEKNTTGDKRVKEKRKNGKDKTKRKKQETVKGKRGEQVLDKENEENKEKWDEGKRIRERLEGKKSRAGRQVSGTDADCLS
jgi:hypothetical protein